MRASDERRRAIGAEIESIRTDRARLAEALIETTAKVQDAERGVAAADERLTSLNAKADVLSRSLESRRAAIVEVLAALQRMGANPPPAILIRPGDMAEAVRAAMVLSSLVPDLKAQADALRRDVDDLSRTRGIDRARARAIDADRQPRWRSRRSASLRLSRRASSRSPRPRTRSARSRSARPISPCRRRPSRS